MYSARGFVVRGSRKWSMEILTVYWQGKAVYVVRGVDRNVKFDEEKSLNQIKVGDRIPAEWL